MAEGGRSPLEPCMNPEWVRVAITGSCGGNRSEVVWIGWCAGTIPQHMQWPDLGTHLGPPCSSAVPPGVRVLVLGGGESHTKRGRNQLDLILRASASAPRDLTLPVVGH